MNRLKRRQQQKQPSPQQSAPTSADSPKPQSTIRLPQIQQYVNPNDANKLAKIAATRPKPVEADITPARTKTTNVRSIHPGKQQIQPAGVRASGGIRRKTDKRPVSSPAPRRNGARAKRKLRRRRGRSKFPLLYGMRLLILCVGIGAIAGTILSFFDPSSRHPVGASATATTQVQQISPADPRVSSPPIAKELPSLKAQIQAMAAKYPQLQPGVFILDIDTGAYLDLQATSTFSAASTIKLPVLVAFFQDVDAGKISLSEQLTMLPELIGSGSGDMQYQKPGTQFTALETVIKMITISDNTATNMLISRLGGAELLNQRFGSWGLTATAIHNPLPDLSGTNTTSPFELASLMARVNQGELVSQRSRARLLDIMQHTVRNTLLPRGLGKGATIAHKTGDIGSLVADVGLIDMPSSKRYIAAVMVKRPYNDPSAQELIREISRTAYQYFSQSQASPNTTSSPSETSAPIRVFTAGNPANTQGLNSVVVK